MAIGCFVSPGRSFDDALDRVVLAEELGYESCYVTHINARESLTVLTAYATRTRRIALGTGVVPIYTRTPATMAQTAATLHDVSGGRLRLGLGVSHRSVVEGWYGQRIDRPVPEMREYVAIVRAILAGERPPAGEKWSTGFALAGLGPFPTCRSTSRASRPGCCGWPARSPMASSCGCAIPSTSRRSSCPPSARAASARGGRSRGSTSSRRCPPRSSTTPSRRGRR